MDDKQWMVTAVLAALFAAAFLYMPFVGHMYVFIALCVAQGIYLGWQDVTAPQSRLGALAFSISVFVSTPIWALILTPNGPGKYWGMVAMIGILAGVIAIFLSRLVRQRRSA